MVDMGKGMEIVMTITEKVAHLKGFIEGIELDETTKEGNDVKKD